MKTRLDQALVVRAICQSREKARRAIIAGQVRVNGQIARKPSDSVRETDHIALDQPQKYVSRGGDKLEGALDAFAIQPAGWTAVDLGASTGGFTDCLLQRGAARVYAVDVGRGQLAWKLRRDPRVVVMEGINARRLTPGSFPPGFAGADLVTIDCSFISLRKIIPSAVALLRRRGKILALVKPQFEAGKKEAGQGRGVITNPAIHERVLRELRESVEALSALRWRQVAPSPLLGPAGNKEFFVLIEKVD